MRTSIKEVARRADVSAMTVSNVLRNRSGRVSPATRERVLQIVRELNYVPVRAALQNRHVETHVVSVVLDHMAIEWHKLDADTFGGIRLAARKAGYDLLVNLREGAEWSPQNAPSWLLDRRSDGFIFVNPRNPTRTRRALHTLVEHAVPAVATHFVDGTAQVPHVVADNISAMRQAVEHLASRGHRHIAHIAGPSWHSETRLRREGFLAAMRACNLEPSVYETGRTGARIDLAVGETLSGNASAVVCWNDDNALDLWKAAEESGRRVPQKLSIIGMDNSVDAALKSLTSITNPHAEIGRAAFESLMALMRGEDAATLGRTLPVQLIERNSVETLKSTP